MTKITQLQRKMNMMKKKDRKIVKLADNSVSGVAIEKKNYTLSELSGLLGKFKKINTELSVDEEKNGEYEDNNI